MPMAYVRITINARISSWPSIQTGPGAYLSYVMSTEVEMDGIFLVSAVKNPCGQAYYTYILVTHRDSPSMSPLSGLYVHYLLGSVNVKSVTGMQSAPRPTIYLSRAVTSCS